ncbi:hypothetical protein DPMN_075515 [Dreissena polymorpha]|uniref:Uncharacterized protein n=1 Tax=Dreissena polymorpha TaxID=45954 RepID=A0A9D3YI92_DREPO|nr:hypothetical protein DPMN_075515 [Dreissena polymorpha]
MEELSQFNTVLQHRVGRKHANADALSRIPEGSCDIRSGDLPCGGCKHCQRADLWDAFTEDVDDAVPLVLPTVQSVVRDIGVFTDESTEGDNGETGSVSEVIGAATGDKSGKSDPEFQEEDLILKNLFQNSCQVDVLTVGGDFWVCACVPEPEPEVQAGSAVSEPSSWGFTFVDLLEAQSHDPDLSFALQWLSKGSSPGKRNCLQQVQVLSFIG